MLLLEHLIRSIRSASAYNPEIQVAPVCILWPDPERQWESIIPMLQQNMPELCVLGDYAPERRMGPAIWLRCVLTSHLSPILLSQATPSDLSSLPRLADATPPPKREGKGGDVSCEEKMTLVFYLPGVSRQDLRAVETCPDHLKPLAELQYRGVIWSQISAKDWTVLAWLKSEQGGLGLDVAQDKDTKNAMLLALPLLLDEDKSLLEGKRLDKDYFLSLLLGGDLVRNILLWLDEGEAFKASRDVHAWKAFVEVCKSKFGFNPMEDGVLKASAKLANHEGPWQSVWERFCEAPKRYPHIPSQIRKCQMPQIGLFTNEISAGGWPQWNEAQEKTLRRDLLSLSSMTARDAIKKLKLLENQHCGRRQLVWAELGESSLACALEHLTKMAAYSSEKLNGASLEGILDAYQTSGWRVDDEVLRALSCIESTNDYEAVTTAIRAVYLPWLENGTHILQSLASDLSSLPWLANASRPLSPSPMREGKGGNVLEEGVILFVDGLRLDSGKRLAEQLEMRGFTVSERCYWSPLPSITATGKPAVSPVAEQIMGDENTTDFEPLGKSTGQSLKGGYHLKKLLTDAGYQILDSKNKGDIQGKAWCEFGNIDSEGHHRGWKLAKYLDVILSEIVERISGLFEAGWKRIQIVTDHGWLLLPGGLPKTELPTCLTECKWGRCAALKSGVQSDVLTMPWYWNSDVEVALANGISCFKSGLDYAHGGLSLQECAVPCYIVEFKTATISHIDITDVKWRGLRCDVAVDGEYCGLNVDIRTHAGDVGTSVVMGIKPFKSSGKASVVVEDDGLEGTLAVILVIDNAGNIMAQVDTVIGEK